MLPLTYNCKKCPAHELANVCAASKTTEAPKEAAVANTAKPVKAVQEKLLALNVSQLKSPEVQPESLSQSGKFFASKLGDRSVPILAKSKLQALFLVPLLLMHVLSQTPGIGSTIQPLSAFLISRGALKTANVPALQFS